MTAGGVNVSEWLAANMPPMPREQVDAIIAKGWDSVAARVGRSTDEELRRDNPGIGDEGIARWRWLAANPPAVKRASDFWYAHTVATP
jgi:hypothetical protein